MAKGTGRKKNDHVYEETRDGVPTDWFRLDIKDKFGKRHRDKFKTCGEARLFVEAATAQGTGRSHEGRSAGRNRSCEGEWRAHLPGAQADVHTGPTHPGAGDARRAPDRGDRQGDGPDAADRIKDDPAGAEAVLTAWGMRKSAAAEVLTPPQCVAWVRPGTPPSA
jgi:hypothetical protein